jgi:DNA polymerase-4
MPMARARRLCPHALQVRPDHSRYGAVSSQVFAILRDFTPHVEGLSIDEALLDVSGLRFHVADGVAVGHAIRARIRGDLDLPASVGVATTKLLAKLASEAAKPDGLLRVPAGAELDFLHPLPIGALWGVGEATRDALAELGVARIGDLAELPRTVLVRRLGEVVGAHLWELASGRDPRPVTTGGRAKSISVEETYATDLESTEAIDDELFAHSERLARRLRTAGVAARTVTLKLRYSDFSTLTRSITLEQPVDETGDLVGAARELVAKVPLGGRRVRLLGLGGTGLVPSGAPRQLALDRPERRLLTAAADRIRNGYTVSTRSRSGVDGCRSTSMSSESSRRSRRSSIRRTRTSLSPCATRRSSRSAAATSALPSSDWSPASL